MSKRKDYTNESHNGYTFIRYVKSTNAGKAIWLCKCEKCGKESEVIASNVISGNSKCRCNMGHRDLSGEEINGIQILSEIGKNSYGKYEYRCKCICGKIFDVVGEALLSGKTKSCGCSRKKLRSRLIDITGKRFDSLIVLWYNKKTSKWHCKCDCGNECEHTGTRLRNKSVRSCGCLKHNANRLGKASQRKFPQWFIDELYLEEDRELARKGLITCNDTKKFICKEHGIYERKVSMRIKVKTMEERCGCPECSKKIATRGSKGEREVFLFILEVLENEKKDRS